MNPTITDAILDRRPAIACYTTSEIEALIADKAFDNDWLRAELDERGALAVIPPKADRARRIECDFAMYRWRHLVENFFCNLKAFRRIATRYDKTDASFAAMIHLVGSLLGSVDIYRRASAEPTRWIMAVKLSSVLT